MYKPSGRSENSRSEYWLEDAELASSIVAGSVEAWHEFIDRYTGLIYSVIRRHFYSENDDEVRSIGVEVLQSLYNGDLGKYRSEASLACWLTVYARNKAIDHFRRLYGRRKRPQGYKDLSELDKKVLKLFYAERLPLDIIVTTLCWFGFDVSVDEIVESIYRIEDTISGRYLEGLTNEHYAKTRGARTQHSLRHLVKLRLEFEARSECCGPDADLVEKELARMAEKVNELVSRLSSQERKIIHLRFNRGWSARKIADKLDIDNYKSVYRLLGKALNKIRESAADE